MHLSTTSTCNGCSVPDADLLPALPQLLGPLLAMASDPNRELRQAVLKTLQVGLVRMHDSDVVHMFQGTNSHRPKVCIECCPMTRSSGNSACMQEFYVEIEATRHVDFAALTRILVDYAQSQGQPERRPACI